LNLKRAKAVKRRMWTDSQVLEQLEHLQVVNGQVAVNLCHFRYMVRALQQPDITTYELLKLCSSMFCWFSELVTRKEALSLICKRDYQQYRKIEYRREREQLLHNAHEKKSRNTGVG
jgi:hypothetical protein